MKIVLSRLPPSMGDLSLLRKEIKDIPFNHTDSDSHENTAQLLLVKCGPHPKERHTKRMKYERTFVSMVVNAGGALKCPALVSIH